MWPKQVSGPGPLALESDVLPIAPRGQAHDEERKYEYVFTVEVQEKIKKKRRTTTIKTLWCSPLHRIKSPCTMTSKVTSETYM